MATTTARLNQVSKFRLAAGSAVAAAVCVTLLLAATSPGLPMAWDEGNAINRAEGIAHWARRWLADGAAAGEPAPTSQQAIAADWRYTTVIEGHPALYGIVIALGRSVSSAWLEPLSSCRLGPIMLFGLAAGAMFYRLWREQSLVAAAAAVAVLCLLPRMFAHAHFASIDGPLVSAWLLAWATFAAARAGWGWAILWGSMLGLALSAKATGWLAPLPFIVWTLAYRDRPGAKALAVGLPVAVAAFVLFNPPLWHHPIQGTLAFFDLNLHRADQPGMNISTWFLGRMYNLDHPLPWYNTLFWTAVTVPVGLLLLAVVGLASVLRRWRLHPAGTLVAANWLVLMVVRALPWAPPHDGVRLFLPCFAFLAILAGIGTSTAIGWSAAATHGYRLRRLAEAAVVAAYLGSATSLAWYSPQWLSYYNFCIGGLRGATAVGMEPTYYWDALDHCVLAWLDENTRPGEKVHVAAGSAENLDWMRCWGTLKVECRPQAPGTYRWYVLQHRPSAWQPEDRWLIERGSPALTKTIRSGGWGPWRLDVPLVEVYPFGQYIEARQLLRPGSHEPPQ